MSVFDAFQDRAIAWGTEHKRGWIAMEQGLGKSRVALLTPGMPAQIICPAYLRLNWLREINKWCNGAKVELVKPKTGYKPGADFYVQSYEANQLVPPASIGKLILDESHYAKTPRAMRTKYARKLANRTPRALFLSGTPMPNRPSELWALGSAIGMTRMTWREWGFRYCAGRIGPWGGYDFSGRSNVAELAELWQQYAFRLTKDEVAALPSKMRRLIVLNAPLDVGRERAYDVGQLRKNPNPVAFVGLAEVLHEHGERKVSAATDYILDILETEKPILVGARHKSVIGALHKNIVDAGYKSATITGDTPMEARQELQDAFNAKQLDALVVNSRAAGLGITLVGGRYGIMVEPDWSSSVNVQLEDRLHRIGQTLPVQWDYLVVDRSIDAEMVRSAMWKTETASIVTGDAVRSDLAALGLL